MMRLLHWVLAPSSVLPPSSFPSEWGLPPPDGPRDGQFSVLYSDVGSKFYHACGPIPTIPNSGWETISPVSTSWKVDTPAHTTEVDIGGDWVLLTEEDAYKIWEQDSKAMQADVLSSSKSSGKVAFTFLPTSGVGKFSIQRNVKFTQPDLKPVLDKFWGVARRSADGSGSPSPDVYATWTYEPGTQTIVLTRIRASKDEFPALLEKLKEAAQSIGRDTIEVWNLPEHLKDVAKQHGGETAEREEHLSAVKWYGSEETRDLLWCFNEKSVCSSLHVSLFVDTERDGVAGIVGAEMARGIMQHRLKSRLRLLVCCTRSGEDACITRAQATTMTMHTSKEIIESGCSGGTIF